MSAVDSLANSRIEDLDNHFYRNYHQLSPSLERFESGDPERRALFYSSPSHHNDLRSPELEASDTDPDFESEGAASGWNPPGVRWFAPPRDAGAVETRSSPPLRSSPIASRDVSPEHFGADVGDLFDAWRVPLPASPEKQTPRCSPEPVTDIGPTTDPATDRRSTSRHASVEREREASQAPTESVNYIRLGFHGETNAFNTIGNFYGLLANNKLTSVLAVIFAWLSYQILFRTPVLGPVPDLVKVAGFAKAFEPMIYLSENGHHQIGDLQETGVAVWDLGESVRSTNMTSAPIIFQELDELSESLKTLSLEMTRFYASVDGDIDSILIVMDWAKRELSQVSSRPAGSFELVFDNACGVLSKVGLLEGPLGGAVKNIFGMPASQRREDTLKKTFHEFLNVLEESINAELTYSTRIFGLYEAIDRQFLNVQRTVIRESDQQERQTDELLSSLWTKVLGSNASKLRKFERNKQLLGTVRQKTVRNKHTLADHNGRLLQLKSNLELLRKRLVSPLVRSDNSSTLSIEDQIRGIEGTYEYLQGVRERQKSKVLELVYGAGSRRVRVVEGYEIDAS